MGKADKPGPVRNSPWSGVGPRGAERTVISERPQQWRPVKPRRDRGRDPPPPPAFLPRPGGSAEEGSVLHEREMPKHLTGLFSLRRPGCWWASSWPPLGPAMERAVDLLC